MRLRRALMVWLFVGVTLAEAAPLPISVQAEVGDDGSVIVEGVRYVDAVPLKAELDRLKKRHANLVLLVKQDRGHLVNFEAIGKVIALFQKAGMPKVGFIVGPQVH